jgi:hypothetical protein
MISHLSLQAGPLVLVAPAQAETTKNDPRTDPPLCQTGVKVNTAKRLAIEDAPKRSSRENPNRAAPYDSSIALPDKDGGTKSDPTPRISFHAPSCAISMLREVREENFVCFKEPCGHE